MDETSWHHNKLANDDSDEFIPIKIAGDTVLVVRSQVRWVKASGDYVRLHTAKHSYLWRKSLTSVEKSWGSHGFVRIHKSFLVLISLVTKVRKIHSGWVVILGSGPDAVDLPVSRRKVSNVKQQWTKRVLL